MKSESYRIFLFILLSFIGIFLFFIPACNNTIPVVVLVSFVRKIFGDKFKYISIISCIILSIFYVLWKIFKVKQFDIYFKGERIRLVFWLLSEVIIFLKMFDINISFIQHPKIGGEVFKLGSMVFITITIAGTLVIFITQSGIVEFVSVLIEPIMRPLFKLPGEAAVNILSSFVSSASVGVYFTEQYYIKKRYTKKQACAVVSNFSVVSVGYIGIIATLARVEDSYGLLILSSFFVVLFMGTIMIRIFPISLIDNKYIDGESEKYNTDKIKFSKRFRLALENGKNTASQFSIKLFLDNFKMAVIFAQKIVGVMIIIVSIVLILVYYTNLFNYIAYPIIPIISFFKIPDAKIIAPSVFIGIVEVSLPTILVGGTLAVYKARFFIALLSIVQIIFFSEAGNAIIASKIPLSVNKLICIFFVRTAIAIPIVAFITHIFIK